MIDGVRMAHQSSGGDHQVVAKDVEHDHLQLRARVKPATAVQVVPGFTSNLSEAVPVGMRAPFVPRPPATTTRPLGMTAELGMRTMLKSYLAVFMEAVGVQTPADSTSGVPHWLPSIHAGHLQEPKRVEGSMSGSERASWCAMSCGAHGCPVQHRIAEAKRSV